MSGRQSSGFTIVELGVVIAVLAILATIAYFAIGDWRSRTATNEVKSDLQNAATALDSYRNFNTGYPSSLTDSLFKPTPTVVLDYTLRGDGSYCLNATSNVRTSVAWYIDSSANKQPLEGSCS